MVFVAKGTFGAKPLVYRRGFSRKARMTSIFVFNEAPLVELSTPNAFFFGILEGNETM